LVLFRLPLVVFLIIFFYCFFFLFIVQQKAQVANLMGNFASGIVGLMSSLVQGWTCLQGNAGVEMANQFAGQFGG
jgi:hypothetical protein